MSISTQQKALFLESARGDWVVRSTDVPQPAAGQVLVRVESSGLNPVDWKIHDHDFAVVSYPTILGFEGAGVIVKLGEGVTNVSIGDKVLMQAEAQNTATNTFQQYAVAYADLVAKIPPGVSFDEAAAVSAGITAAAVGLYAPTQQQGGASLTPPWRKDGRGKYSNQPILILGGATTCGQAAIQLAKLSGFSPIIATLSPRNNDFVKSLGATHTIDRSLPLSSLADSVKAITNEPVKVIYDNVAYPDTQNSAYDILAPGGTLITILPSQVKNLIPAKDVIAPYGSPHPASHRSFGVELWQHISELLESGDFKPNQVEVVSGGLVSIEGALDRLRKDQVSGKKLVVRPQETA